jgi:hypothetical protein
VSQRRFQALMARLVIDPDFRDEVRERGESALGDELEPVERTRLVAVARARGMDIVRTLHKGWRLGKVLSMVPLARVALGDDLFARELGAFWAAEPPRSLYFREEAIAFCDHLLTRSDALPEVPFLEEVVAYERAQLELLKPRPDGTSATLLVRFRHDPVWLLGELVAGRPPRDVLENPCVVAGTVAPGGRITWRVVEGRPTAARIDADGIAGRSIRTQAGGDGPAQH